MSVGRQSPQGHNSYLFSCTLLQNPSAINALPLISLCKTKSKSNLQKQFRKDVGTRSPPTQLFLVNGIGPKFFNSNTTYRSETERKWATEGSVVDKCFPSTDSRDLLEDRSTCPFHVVRNIDENRYSYIYIMQVPAYIL